MFNFKKRPYTETEKEFIKQNYHSLGAKKIAEKLGRTQSAIHIMAYKLCVYDQHKEPAFIPDKKESYRRPAPVYTNSRSPFGISDELHELNSFITKGLCKRILRFMVALFLTTHLQAQVSTGIGIGASNKALAGKLEVGFAHDGFAAVGGYFVHLNNKDAAIFNLRAGPSFWLSEGKTVLIQGGVSRHLISTDDKSRNFYSWIASASYVIRYGQGAFTFTGFATKKIFGLIIGMDVVFD